MERACTHIGKCENDFRYKSGAAKIGLDFFKNLGQFENKIVEVIKKQ